MIILGINGGVRLGYQDVSACLIKDGKTIVAIEEERLTRVKFSPGQLSELSIYKCLEYAGIEIKDVDVLACHGSTWGQTFENILRAYMIDNFGHCPRLVFVHHHDAHAASAFYGSGFDEAMILTMDASGDGVSTQLTIGRDDKIDTIKRYSRPNSLGIFYSIITQFCGFRRDSDEYKLMGMAAYGNPDTYDFSEMLNFKDGELFFDESFLKPIKPGESQPTRQEIAYSSKLTDMFGKRRLRNMEISQKYFDIAASAQKQFENVIVEIVKDFYKKTGIRKICLAGGVALNCLANQKIMDLDFIDDIYVHPASGDSGISLGAAMFASVIEGQKPLSMETALLGPEFSDEQILKTLNENQIKYQKIDDPAKIASQLIAENKVIGWFQGRMEFGPRALGARSILANPAMPNVKDIINKKIKFRENFRPFCPSVTEEDTKKYFVGKVHRAPFMNITFGTTALAKDCTPGIVHADGTARIQTVDEKNQPLYHKLLTLLKERTGHPVVVNTSFNTNNEPIVFTPSDAIATFYRSGLDALVIGNFLVTK
ncbi:MAG TPA: carbamoyltransferase C-terminal domain-containing protein [Bacteroidales bacterium]|nr:carbamoyltransferase C-terminal domain-containing protein [Bacteroidales bacterium]